MIRVGGFLQYCNKYNNSVYQECIKPILLTGTAAEKEAVREILYLCVDTGLRALAPFMPFLSEELYQRLPRNVNQNVESVSVAEYPTPNQVGRQYSLYFKLYIVISEQKLLISLRSKIHFNFF